MPADIRIGDLPAPAHERSGWPWTETSPRLAIGQFGSVDWPRVTVVTPSYNQAEFLEESIRSVLLQGYPNLEYFIMDGGSTDNSVEIIRRYSHWLAGYVSERDRGQSHAINKGLALASGVIMAWLNSDDTYEPGALARIGQAAIDSPEAVLIFGKAYHISRAGRRIGQAPARPYDRRWLLEQGNSIPQPSAFFSQAAWRAVGQLDETLHFAMDYDLWLRLGERGPSRFLPEFLSNQRIYPEAKTSAGDHRHYREVRQVIERYGGSGLPVGFADWLVETHLPMAWAAYRSGDAKTGAAELGYVLDNVPAWQAEDRLAQEIARYAWSLSVGLAGQDSAGLDFAERVCGHLPATVAQPARLRRRVLAALHQASAHRHFARGERAQVWRRVGQTFLHEPKRAKDRGLWAVAVRSLVHSRPAVDQPLPLELVRQRALAWLETLQVDGPVGQYAERISASQGPLEAVGLAAQIRAGWNAPALPPNTQAAWAEFLQANLDLVVDQFQSLEKIEILRGAQPAWGKDVDWESAALAITAFDSLGLSPAHPLSFVERFLAPDAPGAWLAGLNWAQPRAASQRVRHLAVILAREHARTQAAAYWQALEAVGCWLAARVTTETGPWTFGQPVTLLDMLTNACNLAPLFCLLGYPLPEVEPLITRILELQRFSGLFASSEPDQPWVDLTAVDVLARLSRISTFRATEVRLAMALALRAIVRQQQPDGGFAGSSPGATSDLRATWLRSLTLAVIGTRWPHLLAAPMPFQLAPLPELGAGHLSGAPALQP